MNDFYTDELLIAELAACPDRVLGKAACQSTLHYCSGEASLRFTAIPHRAVSGRLYPLAGAGELTW